MRAGEKTKLKILDAGVSVWPNVSLANVRRAAGLKSHRSVSYHFEKDDLRNAIAEHAVKTENGRVILMLVAEGHSAAKHITPQQSEQYLKNL